MCTHVCFLSVVQFGTISNRSVINTAALCSHKHLITPLCFRFLFRVNARVPTDFGEDAQQVEKDPKLAGT